MNQEIENILNDVISDKRHSDLLEKAVAYTNKYDELQHIKVVRGIEKAIISGLLPDVYSPEVQLFILAELIGTGTKEAISDFAEIIKRLDIAGDTVTKKITTGMKDGSLEMIASVKHLLLPLISKSIEDRINQSLNDDNGTIFTQIDSRLQAHVSMIKKLDEEYSGYATKVENQVFTNNKSLSEITSNLEGYTEEVNNRHGKAINSVAKRNIDSLEQIYKDNISKVESKFAEQYKRVNDSVTQLQEGLKTVIDKQKNKIEAELSVAIKEVAKEANEIYKQDLRISWIHKLFFASIFVGAIYATHSFSYGYGKKDTIEKTAEILVDGKLIKEEQASELKALIYRRML